MKKNAYNILHGASIDEHLLPWPEIFVDEMQPISSSVLYLHLRFHDNDSWYKYPTLLAKLKPDDYVWSRCDEINFLYSKEIYPRAEFSRIIPVIVRLVIFREFHNWWGREEEIPCEVSCKIIERTIKVLRTYRDKVIKKYEYANAATQKGEQSND